MTQSLYKASGKAALNTAASTISKLTWINIQLLRNLLGKPLRSNLHCLLSFNAYSTQVYRYVLQFPVKRRIELLHFTTAICWRAAAEHLIRMAWFKLSVVLRGLWTFQILHPSKTFRASVMGEPSQRVKEILLCEHSMSSFNIIYLFCPFFSNRSSVLQNSMDPCLLPFFQKANALKLKTTTDFAKWRASLFTDP